MKILPNMTHLSNLLFAVLLFISSTFAGSCTKIPTKKQYACGRVVNHSKITMRYTTDPNSSKAPNLCNIWNYAIVKCTQVSLFAGNSVGGGSSKPGTDVDAFNSGTEKVTKGQWTKINDLTTITCVGGDDGGMPYCQ